MMILKKMIMVGTIVFYNFTFSMDNLSNIHQSACECADYARTNIDCALRKMKYHFMDSDKLDSTREEISRKFSTDSACVLLKNLEPSIVRAEKECNFSDQRDLVMSKLLVKHCLIGGLVKNLMHDRTSKSSIINGSTINEYTEEYLHLPLPTSLQSCIHKHAIHEYVLNNKLPYVILPDYVRTHFSGTESFIWGDFLQPLSKEHIQICRNINEAALINVQNSIIREHLRDFRHYDYIMRDTYRLPIFMAFRNLTSQLYWCMIAFFNSRGDEKRLISLSEAELIKEIPVIDALSLKKLINREIAIIQPKL